jgi:PAS domain S-box-containing protein
MNFPSLFKPRRRPISAHTALLMMAGVLFLATVGWERWEARNAQLQQAELNTANLARAIAQNGSDNLDKTNLVLSGIVAAMETDRFAPAAMARLQATLTMRVDELPILRNLILLDEHGQRLMAAYATGGQSNGHAQREYVSFHRQHDTPGPHVGMPVQALSNQAWIITISRRINHPDGSFAGVALASISLDTFQRYFTEFNVGAQGVILLAATDGTIIARHPFQQGLTGQRIKGSPLFQNFVSKLHSGNARLASPLDHVQRIYAFNNMEKYGLTTVVSLSQDEVLGPWWTSTLKYFATALALLAGLGVQNWRLSSHARVRARSDAMLRAITDSLPMLVNYTDTEQRYRFNNRAYETWIGKPRDQITGMLVADVLGPVAYEKTRAQLEAALRGEASVLEFCSTAYGAPRDVRVEFMPQFGADGSIEGTVTVISDVGQYKEIQQALLRSQDSLKHAQAITHVGSWEHDLASGQISWSDENYRTHGHAPLAIELNWPTIIAMIHPDDRARVDAAHQQAIMDVCGLHVEFRLLRPDGSVRHVIDDADMVKDGDGRGLRLVGALVDVTERKESRQKLVTSEHLLRSITDSLPMLVGYITPDEKYSFNNHAFTQLTGKPLSEITGHPVKDVTSKESYETCKPHVMAAMAGQRATVDFIHQNSSGRRHMRADLLPQFEPNGTEVLGVVVMLTDVTEFRQIEQQLQASGQLLNNAQKIAHVGSWEYHIASRSIVWSEETYRIFGLEPDLVQPIDFNFCIACIHPEDRARMVAAYGDDLRENHGFELEYRIIRPDGELRHLVDRAHHLQDADGKPWKLAGAVIDITERKLAALEIKAARERELAICYDIQQALLMADVPPELNGAWIATYVEPSQGLHGDFVAVSQHTPTRFNVLVGDVMGKGIHAAMIGAGVKNAYYQVLAELLSCDGPMPDAAAIVNALHQKMTPKLIEMNCFVTLALYVFDAQAGTVSVVNAGHTEGLLARAGSSGDVERIGGDNLPIGVLLSEIYHQHVRRIGNDDQLVMYSDGISEVCSDAGAEFGADGVARWLRQSRDANLPSSAALQSLRQRLFDFGGHARIVDDKTVMMVRLRPVHYPEHHMTAGRHRADYLTLPFRLDALPMLRQHIEQASAHWPREDAEAMLLAVYEAATNAIKHTAAPLNNTCLACRVTVTPAADTLALEMYYPGAPVTLDADQEPDFSVDATGGFGLYIIRNLVDSIDYGVPLEGMVRVKLVKHAGAG